MKALLIDHYDSYTNNVAHLWAIASGILPDIIEHDDERLADQEYLKFIAQSYAALILSPGPGRPDRLSDARYSWAVVSQTRLPTLGICLGMQLIADRSGGKVAPAPVARHGHLSTIQHCGTGLWTSIPQGFTAVRYHSLAASELPTDVIVDAWSQDGVSMGLHHLRQPWWGVQFHPESVASQHGELLLQNFMQLARRWTIAGNTLAPTTATIGTSRCSDSKNDHQFAQHQARTAPGIDQLSISWRALDLWVEPEQAYARLFLDQPASFWLDSARSELGGATTAEMGRWSFLGYPGGEAGEILRKAPTAKILDQLAQRLHRITVTSEPDFPLVGGYVGWLGYGSRDETGYPVPETELATEPGLDSVWLSATRYLVYDHFEQKAWSVAVYQSDSAKDQRAAECWLAEVAAQLAEAPALAKIDAKTADRSEILPHLRDNQSSYQEKIDQAQQQLRAGESYEICLTTEACIQVSEDPFTIYRKLRRLNPAPYAALIKVDQKYLLSSSPEQFLRSDGRQLQTKPIKGTAARHADLRRDAAVAAELAAHPKTIAENLMIVDLLRHDLATVCQPGTVQVPAFLAVESYETVHQLVSTIQGKLVETAEPLDALRACFPGGSMTGAPKRRTLEIIADLEQRSRGPYSGTLGWISDHGQLDLSIIIRTIVISDQTATVGAGGAIVLDSDPEQEFEEMLLKLLPPMSAILPPRQAN